MHPALEAAGWREGVRRDTTISQAQDLCARLVDWLEEHPQDEGVIEAIRQEAVAELRGNCEEIQSPARLVDASFRRLRLTASTSELPREFGPVEPWPDPVDGRELFGELHHLFTRHIHAPEESIDTLLAFAMYTWLFREFTVAPRLSLYSATPMCGKTRTATTLACVCSRGILVADPTPAVLFRMIEAHHPTVIIDEADNLPLEERRSLITMLNSGHCQGLRIPRVGGTDARELEFFDVFAPVVMGSIKALPVEALRTRCIMVVLRRASVTSEQPPYPNLYEETANLRRKLQRWSQDVEPNRTPRAPQFANDRARDNWRPLLAVGELLGVGSDEHLRIFRAATIASRFRPDDDDLTLPERLLKDLREHVFTNGLERVPTQHVIRDLVGIDGAPWKKYGRAREEINSRQLARLLKDFGVRSKTMKFGGGIAAKGYLWEDIEPHHTAYFPPPPSLSVTAVTLANDNDLGVTDSTSGKPPSVTPNPSDSNEVTEVTDREGVLGEEGQP